MEQVFKPVYADIDNASDDRVGLVFVVLSCACLLDPARQANPPEAKQFFHLSKVSIMLGEVRTSFAVQCLALYLVRTYSNPVPYSPFNIWYAILRHFHLFFWQLMSALAIYGLLLCDFRRSPRDKQSLGGHEHGDTNGSNGAQ